MVFSTKETLNNIQGNLIILNILEINCNILLHNDNIEDLLNKSIEVKFNIFRILELHLNYMNNQLKMQIE